MSSENKAKHLIQMFTDNLFESGYTISKPMIKQCALIAVGALINEYQLGSSSYEYWQEVKKEIQSF